jgi:putative endonuclease
MSESQPLEQHYVYIAQCANGSLYTGYSKNVERRIRAHNTGKGGRYTRANRPIALLAYCRFKTKTAALQAEYAIKQLPRQKKLALIKNSVQQLDTEFENGWHCVSEDVINTLAQKTKLSSLLSDDSFVLKREI